jgi:cobalt/nickel transport system permease protein
LEKAIKKVLHFRLFDDLAARDNFVNKINPLAKLFVTLFYITVILSFNRYEVLALLPFVLYPVIIILLADIPTIAILKKLLFVEPLIIGIGIFNPIFDSVQTQFGSFAFSRGWLTLLAIILKSSLTMVAALLLVSTTRIDALAEALRKLKIPKILVLQLLLTYRYISVLTEEVGVITRAYLLRAPNQKRVELKAWGSLSGQLLLRAFDRAERVYSAMLLRGFSGEYSLGEKQSFGFKDFVFLFICTGFFVLARLYNLPLILGSIF